MDKLIFLLLLLTACTPSATSTESSASADSAADASASQGMQHTETGKSEAMTPIIVNCIQVYTNDPNVHVGPCIYRTGQGLPGDKILDDLVK